MTICAPSGFRPPKHGVKPAGEPRLYELRQGQCRYPIGFDDGEHRFCAAPVERWGAPYCAEHRARARRARGEDR
jgi:hypothetical protein